MLVLVTLLIEISTTHGHVSYSQDVAKSVTKIAIQESQAQDLRNEILNSEK